MEQVMNTSRMALYFKDDRRRGWFVVLMVLLAVRVGGGQAVTTVVAPTDNETSAGFVVTKVDRTTLDQFEDFDRYAKKKAWDQAFRTIGKIGEEDKGGLASAGDGFAFPIARRMTQSLAGLPPEGKEAYRLFYDPKPSSFLNDC